MSRYYQKPFLRVVECYVLSVIGEMSKEDEVILKELEPKLQELYHQKGNWAQIVEAELQIDENTKSQILEIYKRNRELAAKNGEELPAEHFAQMFVDENFNL